MDDFISREDTIEKMEEVDWYHQNKNGEMVHGANPSEHQAWYKAEDVYKVLEDMPDVRMTTGACWGCQCEKMEKLQSERPKGEWTPTYSDCGDDVWVVWKCSECGYVRKKGWDHTNGGEKPDALFCEMCGADMRGEQE